MKRDDLIHPEISGNKWRKLSENIKAFKKGNYNSLLTFGGPFSNHISASAAAAKMFGIASHAIIRGSYEDPQNPTLSFARSCGMTLHHVSKKEYSLKERGKTATTLSGLSHVYIVPEGGNNIQGIAGIEALCKEIINGKVSFTDIFVAAGTGTTAAGLIRYLPGHIQIHIINVLKNPGLKATILQHAGMKRNWCIHSDYHCGGFAKTTPQLIGLMNRFISETKINLDPIYTGKVLFALKHLLKTHNLATDARILLLHTGGVQGAFAHNYLYRDRPEKIIRLTE